MDVNSWTLILFLMNPNLKIPVQMATVQGFRSEDVCKQYGAEYFPQINGGLRMAKRKDVLVGVCTQVMGPVPPLELKNPGNIADIDTPAKIVPAEEKP